MLNILNFAEQCRGQIYKLNTNELHSCFNDEQNIQTDAETFIIIINVVIHLITEEKQIPHK